MFEQDVTSHPILPVKIAFIRSTSTRNIIVNKSVLCNGTLIDQQTTGHGRPVYAQATYKRRENALDSI